MADEITAEQVAELRALLDRVTPGGYRIEPPNELAVAMASIIPILPALLSELTRLQGLEARVKGMVAELGDSDELPVATAACFALIGRAVSVNAKRGEFKFESVHGFDGEQLGDWRVLVERVALLALDGEGE